jgi:hypothetical protein
MRDRDTIDSELMYLRETIARSALAAWEPMISAAG